jgi:hypothetical protein
MSGDPRKLKMLPANRAKLYNFLGKMGAKIAKAESQADFILREEKTLGVQIIEVV